MTSPKILIAGIGNIFLGDDAFGVEVVRRLAATRLPQGVDVIDFGIRGFDLACAIGDGYDAVILVDASPRGGTAGTLYVIEPDQAMLAASGLEPLEGHSMSPAQVLQWAREWGGCVPHLRLVGCEPATSGADDDMRMELSQPVAQAVEEALPLIRSLIEDFTSTWLTPAGPPGRENVRHRGRMLER